MESRVDAGPTEAGCKRLWTLTRADSPVIGTAIHDGSGVRESLQDRFALSAHQRQREEDPFTAFLINDVPNQVVGHRSRFEFDLNRSRDGALYLTPEQAWGLKVWREPLPQEEKARSLALHDSYYTMLRTFLKQIELDFGRFVVLDVHSYNHRRAAPDVETSQEDAPDINIGTFSMDRDRWAYVVDQLIEHLQTIVVNGRPLDVRENVAFQGRGEQTRFIHEAFPETGCAVAIEFKKIFMDEWTGEPNRVVLDELRRGLAAAVPLLERILGYGS
ncbi:MULTISPECIES: N-formylglutamate amidohydrolase [unclassified Rhizobium]|uniref:N-formylglutamate amidohydrolase n=1 Tax=unclassified Rhizobium TaxID=2613769 RepID=UPI001615DD3C|nr:MULTISPECIES: N-formylglutamate amidohydrolase [unclassified Rhizobium]